MLDQLSSQLRTHGRQALVGALTHPVLMWGAGCSALLLRSQGASLQVLILVTLGLVLLLSSQLLSHHMRLARRRRDHYQSGDVARVRAAVTEELKSGLAPVQLQTLALAGTGDFAAARRALLNNQHCDLEDQELQLCAKIVILSFEGQQGSALGLCRRLLSLPLVDSSQQRSRQAARREGIVALARAVAGAADEGDYLALSRASGLEPALYWACRYGAAVACYVKDERELACRLVEHAPLWPKDSVFRRIHSRIVAAGRSPTWRAI